MQLFYSIINVSCLFPGNCREGKTISCSGSRTTTTGIVLWSFTTQPCCPGYVSTLLIYSGHVRATYLGTKRLLRSPPDIPVTSGVVVMSSEGGLAGLELYYCPTDEGWFLGLVNTSTSSIGVEGRRQIKRLSSYPSRCSKQLRSVFPRRKRGWRLGMVVGRRSHSFYGLKHPPW